MLPYILLSIPAGIITDRFDRRLVLLTSDLARAVCMLVLAWIVATDGPLWAVGVVAILAACFSTFFYPAIGALIPSLVRDEREFGPANSAWATLDNLAWIVGPGIAGLLLATGDIVLAFVLNAVSFTLIAGILWTLPRQAPAAAPGGTPTPADPASPAAEPVADDVAAGPRHAHVPRPTNPVLDQHVGARRRRPHRLPDVVHLRRHRHPHRRHRGGHLSRR